MVSRNPGRLLLDPTVELQLKMAVERRHRGALLDPSRTAAENRDRATPSGALLDPPCVTPAMRTRGSLGSFIAA
jgi:hypothetical protein